MLSGAFQLAERGEARRMKVDLLLAEDQRQAWERVLFSIQACLFRGPLKSGYVEGKSTLVTKQV